MKKQFEGKTKMKKNYKNSNRGIAAILTLCILLGIAGIGVHATAMVEETTEKTAVATEKTTAVVKGITTVVAGKTTIVTEDTTQELVPVRSGTGDQYANRYFATLADAKAYYGSDFTYTACTPFEIAPGCYGGYWSNGGTYTYYYTFDDGSRCYLHIGV